ncbi:hypothetical protein CWATWH0003_4391t4, partial [Crocosphaera watsonii WH 0003]
MNEPNSILGSFQTGNNETNVNSLVPEESGSEIYSSSLVGESLPEEDELEITARLLEEESYLETNLEQDTISLLGNSQDNDLYLRTNVDQELEYSYDGITFWGDINGETSELEPYQLSDNSQIIVDLKEGLDRLFVDQSLSEDLANFGATLTFYGGEGSDSLMGTQLNSLWEIEGENSGNLNQYILFEDLENLIGEEDNQDTFILKEGASLSGVLDGGEGGYDVLEIEGTTYESVTYTAFDAHSGTVNLDGNLIEFAGLEPVTIDGDADDMTIDLSSLDGVSSSDDQATLLNAATDGQITLRSDNSTFEHTTFNNPTNSLTIKLGGGDDSLTVESLDDAFSADLIISGDDNNLLNLDDPGDSVTFVSDLYLNGGNLEVTAETITVNDGVTISTRQVASDHVSGDSTGDS